MLSPNKVLPLHPDAVQLPFWLDDDEVGDDEVEDEGDGDGDGDGETET